MYKAMFILIGIIISDLLSFICALLNIIVFQLSFIKRGFEHMLDF